MAFLKDRAIAEQVAKESLEEMLQSDVDNLKDEIGIAMSTIVLIIHDLAYRSLLFSLFTLVTSVDMWISQSKL